MNSKFRKISLFLLLGFFAFGLSACNTLRGVGKDTEVVGEKIQESAEENGADEQPQPQPQP